tara:strand:- start:112531 stop:113580 length:1050 start_codon:yes stop_codon:yes gene_type:complete
MEKRKFFCAHYNEDFIRRKKELSSDGFKDSKDIEEVSLNELIELWLDRKGEEFTLGYYRVLNPALKRIRNLYGTYKVSKFTPMLLFEFRSSLKSEGLSTSTQNRYVDIIVRIINFAFQQNVILVNPTLGYEKAREKNNEMFFLDEKEVSYFLKLMDKKYPKGHKYRWVYLVYLMSLETGIRARELWGLMVSDIPINGNKLKIYRQWLGNKYSRPKGKEARFVPLSDKLRDELISELITPCKNQFKDQVDSELILFRNKVGDYIDHDNFVKRVFKKDIEEAGFSKLRFHDLRHTAITLMVKKNIPMPIVQKIAGHKDIKTTMRYVHIVGSDIEELGNSISLGAFRDSSES